MCKSHIIIYKEIVIGTYITLLIRKRGVKYVDLDNNNEL